jgi:hypothetical protein
MPISSAGYKPAVSIGGAYEEDFVVKASGRVIDYSRRLFHSINFGCKRRILGLPS